MARQSLNLLAIFILFVILQDIRAELANQPLITVQPESGYFAGNSDPTTINCEATGTPAPTYTWYHNGTLKVAGQSTGNYTITGNTFDLNGYYTCHASNKWGTAVSRSALMQRAFLNGFPSTPTQAFSQQAGLSYWMDCRSPPASVPTATYSWAQVTAATTEPSDVTLSTRVQVDKVLGRIHFANLQDVDHSSAKPIYACSASNVLSMSVRGSYSNLTVRLPASTVTTRPNMAFRHPLGSMITVLEGDDVTLRCFFYGFPTPSIRWYREVVELVGAEEFNTTFIVRSVTQADDQVTYKCFGSNSASTNEQLTFKFNVDIVPMFGDNETAPSDVNVTIGDTANFDCIPRAKPPATITWFANGKPINAASPPARYSVSADGSSLTITDVCLECGNGTSDYMVVTCNASNVHGYVLKQAFLNVIQPTSISKDGAPADNKVPAGERATFQCVASSDPSTPITFEWLFNNVSITEDPNKIHSTSTDTHSELVIENVAESDGGEYTCLARNGYSESDATATLEVLPPLAVFSAAALWYVWFIIALVVVFLVLLIFCCCYCKDNDGDAYPVDEIEQKMGNNPEKELRDTGLREYYLPPGAVPSTYQVWTVGSGSQAGSKFGGGDVTSIHTAPLQLAFPPPPPATKGPVYLDKNDGFSDSSDVVIAHPLGQPVIYHPGTGSRPGSRPLSPRGEYPVQLQPQQQQFWPDEEPERDMMPPQQRMMMAGPAYAVMPHDATPVPAYNTGFVQPAPGMYPPNYYDQRGVQVLPQEYGYDDQPLYNYPEDAGYNGQGYGRRPPSESSV